jgi:hypothetical protein
MGSPVWVGDVIKKNQAASDKVAQDGFYRAMPITKEDSANNLGGVGKQWIN